MKNLTKEQAWDYGINMVKVDGLKPSDKFLELVELEKEGKITTKEMRAVILKKYLPEDVFRKV